MNTYIMNFIVYTFAMIGFLLMVLFVYKKAVYSAPVQNNKNMLNVETSMKLSPTKTIYVINAGKERFLIAGDTANTTMLAKLENTDFEPGNFSANTLQRQEEILHTTSDSKR
ncbi:MAG: flagellar biosynthetic protein FliO [Candidatus Avigastranaerophilus sp.]